MPIGTAGAIALGAGSAIGGIAGAQGNKSTQTSVFNLAPETSLEAGATSTVGTNYGLFEGLINQGAGGQDVATGTQAQRDLAALLDQYSKSGGLPNAQDISTSQGFAKDIFARRQEELNQSFIQQNTEAQRLAGRLGRPVNDPILQAKLRTGYLNQQDLLNAEKQGFATQTALALPQQRLGYATDRTNLLSGLASQAFQNRAALLEAGSNLLGAERNYRLGRSGQTITAESGGGLGGALSGLLAGAGAGAQTFNLFSGANRTPKLSGGSTQLGQTPQSYSSQYGFGNS